MGFKFGRELSIEILNQSTPFISVRVAQLPSWTKRLISANPNRSGAKNSLGEDSDDGAA